MKIPRIRNEVTEVCLKNKEEFGMDGIWDAEAEKKTVEWEDRWDLHVKGLRMAGWGFRFNLQGMCDQPSRSLEKGSDRFICALQKSICRHDAET